MIAFEKDELDLELKKYKLDDLLVLLAKKSQEMYKQGVAIEKVVWRHPIGGLVQKESQLMPVWGLAELSYRAIKNSNDYRPRNPTLQDIYKFNNLLAKVTDEAARRESKDRSPDESKIDIFLGLSQTQFWWQDLVRTKVIFYNFLRYYLLLKKMPKYFTEFTHPNKDLLDITGFEIKDFSKLLCAGYAWLYTNSPEINLDRMDKSVTKEYPIITPENLLKCLEFFVGDYEYYRRKDHPYNPLFFKPIIKTQTNRLIISNAFIWVRKFYEGIYWIIRDKYLRSASRTFTAAFGHYYEKYIEELLKHYLTPEKFQRIKEKGKADWLIYTGKYLLIVEQKSSLMSVSLKTEYPSPAKLDEYLEIFKKACIQLKNTSDALRKSQSTVIKLILHFERLHFKESFLKKKLEELCKDYMDNLRKYYLVDTDEFEQLIQTLSENIDSFNKIVEAKINYEENPPPPTKGTDFRDIIYDVYGWREVKFLEKYSYIFDNIV